MNKEDEKKSKLTPGQKALQTDLRAVFASHEPQCREILAKATNGNIKPSLKELHKEMINTIYDMADVIIKHHD